MQAALAEATRAAVDASHGVPVPPNKFHFTLAFLGSTAESRIAELSQIAARVASTCQAGGPVTVTLDRIEYWRKSQILCATSTTESAAAVAFAACLTGALTANGFAPDLKPFRAHATLARKVRRITREQDKVRRITREQDKVRRIAREQDMVPVRWSFHDFRLVESCTDTVGVVYSSREIWPLYARSR